MIATLFNIFNDAQGLNQFSFANADEHLRINEAIVARNGPALSYYVLDPIPTGPDAKTWLRTHQDIHNQMNAVLGLAGNDLSEVDFNDPDQVASWIWLHAQEHVAASDKLRLP